MKRRWVRCSFSIYRKREMNQNRDGKIKVFKYFGRDGKRAAFIVHRVQETFSREAWRNPLGKSV